MKKLNIFFVVAILATALFSACGEEPDNNGNNNNNTQEVGVVINGITWATRNVSSTGTFVNNPENYGGYYQWNKKDTANFLLHNAYFASSFSKATSWSSANDPCPTGWRVPTIDEFQTLLL